MAANKAFTLLETVTVLLVIGILAAVAIPILDSALAEARLGAGVSEIATAFEFAQLTSITTGLPCRVTVDAATDTVLVEQARPSDQLTGSSASEINQSTVETTTFATMPHPVRRGSDYRVVFTQEHRLGQVDITGSTCGTDAPVAFDTLGIPSTAAKVAVATGHIGRTITVDPLSGRVTHTGN